MRAGAYVSGSLETLNLLVRDAAPEVYLPALHALALLINSAGTQFVTSGYAKGTLLLLISRMMAEVQVCSLLLPRQPAFSHVGRVRKAP